MLRTRTRLLPHDGTLDRDTEQAALKHHQLMIAWHRSLLAAIEAGEALIAYNDSHPYPRKGWIDPRTRKRYQSDPAMSDGFESLAEDAEHHVHQIRLWESTIDPAMPPVFLECVDAENLIDELFTKESDCGHS